MNVTTWTALVAAEPRLKAVLDAALPLVGTGDHLHAEAVYVMTKPLIGWLAGQGRGRAPQHDKRGIPEGTRLWAMNTVARPFAPEPSPLDTVHAFVSACSHINEFLHQAQQRQEAA